MWSDFNNVVKEAATGVTDVGILEEENAFRASTTPSVMLRRTRMESSPRTSTFSFHPNSEGDGQMTDDLELALRLP